MGKKLSKNDRACILTNEILEDFSEGKKLSLLLRKSAALARLIGDSRNQRWIDKEITGSLGTADLDDLMDISLNGRYWTFDSKPFYRLEHVEVLEELIETEKIRLAAAKDPNISYNPVSAYDSYHPHNNIVERNQIVESIKNMQSILSKVRGRLIQFVLDTHYALNYSEIVTELFSSTRKKVEGGLKTLAPEALKELSAAYESVNSNNHANWSNVASGCRRVLMQVADKVYPPSEKTVEDKKGKKIKLDADHWRLRIKECLKGQKYEDAISRDSLEYLSELLDSIGRLYAEGDKKVLRIDKSVAEKILIYTYLVVGDILGRMEPTL